MRKIIKKIIWNLKCGYKPKEFWDDWAETFMDDPWQVKIHIQHKWFLKKIKSLNLKNILEVGCGFGRNINFLIENGVNPASITGIDISSEMIKLARKYINNRKVKLFVSDLAQFDIIKKFDLVFTHGVLMHIPEDQIDTAINRLVDLSRKNVVLMEQNYNADNNYTFVHNYNKLLARENLDMIEYRRSKKLGLDLIYVKVR